MRLFLSVAALLALTSFPASAQDEAESGWTLSGAVDVVSDYRFRGVSQTDNEAALQGSLSASHAGFAASIWASTVDDFADAEIDFTVSQSWDSGAGSLTAGAIYYAYVGASELDYLEGFASWSHEFDRLGFTGSVYYSPDFFAGSGSAIYLNAAAAYALTENLSATAQFGRQWIESNSLAGLPDYYNWGVGLSWSEEPVTLSLGYEDTDISGSICSGPCEEGVVAKLSLAF